MKIQSINNPKVKEWSKLKTKKYRDLKSEFIIEGDHLLKSALNFGVVKEVIATDTSFEIPNIPFYEVTDAIMKKLSSQASSTNVLAICQKIENNTLTGNVALLDNIQDPANLGAIIRSATAFNIKTIILSNDTVSLYNEKVIRASEGMLFNLNYQIGDLNEKIKTLKEKGYTIYGTDVNKGNSLKNISFSNNSAIIIGNEGRGMQEDLKLLCDELINIPINSNCESLNASHAASIIFYELDSKRGE